MDYKTESVTGTNPDRLTKWNGSSWDALASENPNGSGRGALPAVHLAIDPKRIELWELEVMESGNLGNSLLVLARYLVDSDGRAVSPELSPLPIDELPRGEIARIKNSTAYRRLRRFNVAQLEEVTEKVTLAGAGFRSEHAPDDLPAIQARRERSPRARVVKRAHGR